MSDSLEDNFTNFANRAYREFHRARGQRRHNTKEAGYEWLTTHKHANGSKNMPLVTWPG